MLLLKILKKMARKLSLSLTELLLHPQLFSLFTVIHLFFYFSVMCAPKAKRQHVLQADGGAMVELQKLGYSYAKIERATSTAGL